MALQNFVRKSFRACRLTLQKRHAASTATATARSLKRTILYNFHIDHGGKMVPFAGWEMPVQYKDSITASHNHVRQAAGLFDVSHMLQTVITGKDCVRFMETLVVSDLEGLNVNQGTLTVFTNEQGGIQDDLIVTKTDDGNLYVVSNAACSENDYANMQASAVELRRKGWDVEVDMLCNGLLALQGPDMTKTLQPGLDTDLSRLSFMTTTEATVFGVPNCRITRCGYTGEDGVEISVPCDDTEKVAKALVASKDADVKLIGLGARDTLRLEAGLCLYGNDIDIDTTPVEASLAWTIGKRRRKNADFPGATVIMKQLTTDKPSKKRAGFISTGAPIRGGTQIYDADGECVIGKITSGCPSPYLKKNISMGYIDTRFTKVNTAVKFNVRNRMVDGVVAKMPFVPCHYYIPK